MGAGNSSTIILCGAPINYASLPIGTNHSNAMIPINGKPVIGWILDDLLAKHISSATIVLRQDDQKFITFLKRAYDGRMKLNLVLLAESRSILDSLSAGLKASQVDGFVRVILGDTLIRESFDGEEDFVYVGDVDDSRRWCLIVTSHDGQVVEYIDKKSVPQGMHRALAGYYHLQNGKDLLAAVEESRSDGERELSFALRRYGKRHPITTRVAREWYDFGHIDMIVDARRRLLRPRGFNTLSVNPVLNTITKVSAYDEKLREELDWYLNIPDELKVLAPRILSTEKKDGRIQIVQEYYGYPTLAELYVYGELDPDAWTSILKLVLRIHQEFRRYPGSLPDVALEDMYVTKTMNRLELLQRQSTEWRSLLAETRVVHNGRELRNFSLLTRDIHSLAKAISSSTPVSIIHGDYCFSNILFDPNNQIVRLIDPRGSFGVKGIYGDARYDIAKLRHSVCGKYDYIVADMFDLSFSNGEFASSIYASDAAIAASSVFDRLVAEAGYDLKEINFIEGLLFISMLPFHSDNSQRQRMMYLTGLELLNDVVG